MNETQIVADRSYRKYVHKAQIEQAGVMLRNYISQQRKITCRKLDVR